MLRGAVYWASLWTIALISSSVLLDSADAQERHALLIGNSNYGGGETLLNPARDVDAMKPVLEALGFKVTTVQDANQEMMEDAVVSFSKLLGAGKIGIFFYAGHGMQVEGINYMIPVGAKIRAEVDVKRKCVDIGYVLESMEHAENSFNVVVLDCCRDNPYKRGWRRSAQKGLAAIADVPDGSIIAFSTAPGRTAEDGRNQKNSPYTASLVKVLGSRPAGGLELVDAFRAVGRDVRNKSGQRPWMNLDSSLDEYYLWRGDGAPSPPRQPTRPSITNSIGMKLILIPGGQFEMGSDAENTEAYTDEKPRHTIRISRAFYLGRTEVTQAQWRSVMGTTPWKGQRYVMEGADYAATNVTWTDAVAFCRKLSQRDGRQYRLPTEAEWEYACRAGSSTKYGFGDSDADIDNYAWWGGVFGKGNAERERYAHEVGRKRPNAWGLFDMHGNVWEWCSDAYRTDFYKNSPMVDPKCPEGSHQLFRGGSWADQASECRAANRGWRPPGSRDFSIGFRVQATYSP